MELWVEQDFMLEKQNMRPERKGVRKWLFWK